MRKDCLQNTTKADGTCSARPSPSLLARNVAVYGNMTVITVTCEHAFAQDIGNGPGIKDAQCFTPVSRDMGYGYP